MVTSGPMPGLNWPLRHGMGKEAEINRRADDFLDREEAVRCVQPAPGYKSIVCRVEEINDRTLAHEGELASVLFEQLR